MRNKINYVLVFLVIITMAGGYALYASQKDSGTAARKEPELKQLKETSIGASFSLPLAYVKKSKDTPGNEKTVPINFERKDPQGFMTVRYEPGLGKPANLARQSLIEYIGTQITQFFPAKYSGYKFESVKRVNVSGREAIEHIFSYNDIDGNQIKCKLIAIPYDQDSAYYFILQSHAGLFGQIKDDIKYDHIQLAGPN